MAKEEDRAAPRRAEQVCPACKQPVETVVKRRKVLGAYVPSWGPGPCHHDGCAARVAEGEGEGEGDDRAENATSHGKPSRSERLERLRHP
ncbi:hypothetical protein QIS99_06855 [Streptomyces sp. B-S-A8]|uniref:Uncharacterized protein n=1 Tax=Streptomyces solicavernae TaxID=3043614 RepID=A0ABT6RNE4_9ACTN|nr:hypothetical protein [Streptomyces sp. B-S-A8]MDI3385939.1 hypothetical protein [Streptomyces sp. B-S-A8]